MFSSHQLELVEDVCQDVAIIKSGSVVAAGDLEDLRARAAHRRLEVIVDGNHWFPRLDGLDAGPGPDGRSSIVDRDVPLDRILASAQAAGSVDRFAFEPPTLTDIFREAVAE